MNSSLSCGPAAAFSKETDVFRATRRRASARRPAMATPTPMDSVDLLCFLVCCCRDLLLNLFLHGENLDSKGLDMLYNKRLLLSTLYPGSKT